MEVTIGALKYLANLKKLKRKTKSFVQQELAPQLKRFVVTIEHVFNQPRRFNQHFVLTDTN